MGFIEEGAVVGMVAYSPMNPPSLLSDLAVPVIDRWSQSEGRDWCAQGPVGGGGRVALAKQKATAAWQEELWRRWPREECWPAKLDVYEAAAYLRVSPDTIRRAVVVARDGKAKLAHQRLGSVYRFRKADLDEFGAVAGRR